MLKAEAGHPGQAAGDEQVDDPRRRRDGAGVDQVGAQEGVADAGAIRSIA